jgi:tousled-like kinase
MRRYVNVRQEVVAMELTQDQQRLGTVATLVSSSAKWIGGLEVERVDRHIESLTKRLDDLKARKDKSDPIWAHRKSTLSQELKEQRQVRKQLEDDRIQLGIRLRVSGDALQSEFKPNQTLNDGQFTLIQYLGRGGISEVWLAFDTIEIRHVALKIQKMNPQWTRVVKENFVRHSGREIKILSLTHHENVVAFFGHFYIDDNTVVMVMEYCAGGDLADLIRKRGKLPEKEARFVLIQVLQGLMALRSKDTAVIHYDLKPANILFNDDGVVKVTDFGLSKIVDCDESTFELTSQGTGTYYYAAPETFQKGRSEAVRINTTVDTWSLGIIFYEMLYGQRPFGDDQSQTAFASHIDAVIGKVVFPSTTKVSDAGKSFILRCLDRDSAARPVLEALFRSDYVQTALG